MPQQPPLPEKDPDWQSTTAEQRPVIDPPSGASTPVYEIQITRDDPRWGPPPRSVLPESGSTYADPAADQFSPSASRAGESEAGYNIRSHRGNEAAGKWAVRVVVAAGALGVAYGAHALVEYLTNK